MRRGDVRGPFPESQEVEADKLRSFELFRNELGGVEVVTFDELAAKAEALLELFRAEVT